MKYYFDSNIFIYSVTEEVVGDRARRIIEYLENGELEAATSILTIDEVVWIVQREADRSTAIETGKKILEIPNLEILKTDSETGVKSLDLMEENSLDPRDSMHLATAQKHGIYTLLTEDQDMKEHEKLETVDTKELLERIEK